MGHNHHQIACRSGAVRHRARTWSLSAQSCVFGMRDCYRYELATFAKLPEAWRIGSIEDIAGIPFILLAATSIGFFFEPAINTYSRSIEYQADLYGFNLYANKTAFARTFVSLAKQNLADPLPPKLIRLWSFSHPSLGERIISAMESGR